ncbi:SsgA family sporulation/cell division regulator [Saccharothrix sp. AJ9571]|nr:SsgA family sporulation/cell division regulator [Saccharothrix sp. AJ9571]
MSLPLVTPITATAVWPGASAPIRQRVHTVLAYSTDDPLAVTLTVDMLGSFGPRWVFAVDLLITGMGEPAGEDAGLVQVMPTPGEGVEVRALHVAEHPGQSRWWRLVYPRLPLGLAVRAIKGVMPSQSIVRRRASVELNHLAESVQKGRPQ